MYMRSIEATEGIIAGVSRGSIQRPFKFYIFLIYLFLVAENSCFSDYPDETTVYCYGKNMNTFNKRLISGFALVIDWLHET